MAKPHKKTTKLPHSPDRRYTRFNLTGNQVTGCSIAGVLVVAAIVASGGPSERTKQHEHTRQMAHKKAVHAKYIARQALLSGNRQTKHFTISVVCNLDEQASLVGIHPPRPAPVKTARGIHGDHGVIKFQCDAGQHHTAPTLTIGKSALANATLELDVNALPQATPQIEFVTKDHGSHQHASAIEHGITSFTQINFARAAN